MHLHMEVLGNVARLDLAGSLGAAKERGTGCKRQRGGLLLNIQPHWNVRSQVGQIGFMNGMEGG